MTVSSTAWSNNWLILENHKHRITYLHKDAQTLPLHAISSRLRTCGFGVVGLIARLIDLRVLEACSAPYL